MKREDLRSAYYEASGTASATGRQLALAGIAAVWIFKTGSGATQAVPAKLVPAAGLFILYLALDFLQYVCRAAIWGGYNRIQERRGIGPETQFVAPWWINVPALVLFWSKIVALAIASGILVYWVWGQWRGSG